MNPEPQYDYNLSQENNQVENLDQRIWGIRPFFFRPFFRPFPFRPFFWGPY
jgi:hypothetical protein